MALVLNDHDNDHAGQTITESVFIEQPESLDLCIINTDTVVLLQWKAQYEQCDGPAVAVKTLSHTLHPSNIFVPNEVTREYNVTVNDVCNSVADTTEINVTLSINLSEHVLHHVPYIVCIITRLGDDAQPLRHRSQNVYLKACTTTTVAFTDMSTMSSFSNTENSTAASTPWLTNDSAPGLQSKLYIFLCSILFLVLLIVLK